MSRSILPSVNVTESVPYRYYDDKSMTDSENSSSIIPEQESKAVKPNNLTTAQDMASTSSTDLRNTLVNSYPTYDTTTGGPIVNRIIKHFDFKKTATKSYVSKIRRSEIAWKKAVAKSYVSKLRSSETVQKKVNHMKPSNQKHVPRLILPSVNVTDSLPYRYNDVKSVTDSENYSAIIPVQENNAVKLNDLTTSLSSNGLHYVLIHPQPQLVLSPIGLHNILIHPQPQNVIAVENTNFIAEGNRPIISNTLQLPIAHQSILLNNYNNNFEVKGCNASIDPENFAKAQKLSSSGLENSLIHPQPQNVIAEGNSTFIAEENRAVISNTLLVPTVGQNYNKNVEFIGCNASITSENIAKRQKLSSSGLQNSVMHLQPQNVIAEGNSTFIAEENQAIISNTSLVPTDHQNILLKNCNKNVEVKGCNTSITPENSAKVQKLSSSVLQNSLIQPQPQNAIAEENSTFIGEDNRAIISNTSLVPTVHQNILLKNCNKNVEVKGCNASITPENSAKAQKLSSSGLQNSLIQPQPQNVIAQGNTTFIAEENRAIISNTLLVPAVGQNYNKNVEVIGCNASITSENTPKRQKLSSSGLQNSVMHPQPQNVIAKGNSTFTAEDNTLLNNCNQNVNGYNASVTSDNSAKTQKFDLDKSDCEFLRWYDRNKRCTKPPQSVKYIGKSLLVRNKTVRDTMGVIPENNSIRPTISAVHSKSVNNHLGRVTAVGNTQHSSTNITATSSSNILQNKLVKRDYKSSLWVNIVDKSCISSVSSSSAEFGNDLLKNKLNRVNSTANTSCVSRENSNIQLSSTVFQGKLGDGKLCGNDVEKITSSKTCEESTKRTIAKAIHELLNSHQYNKNYKAAERITQEESTMKRILRYECGVCRRSLEDKISGEVCKNCFQDKSILIDLKEHDIVGTQCSSNDTETTQENVPRKLKIDDTAVSSSKILCDQTMEIKQQQQSNTSQTTINGSGVENETTNSFLSETDIYISKGQEDPTSNEISPARMKAKCDSKICSKEEVNKVTEKLFLQVNSCDKNPSILTKNVNSKASYDTANAYLPITTNTANFTSVNSCDMDPMVTENEDLSSLDDCSPFLEKDVCCNTESNMLEPQEEYRESCTTLANDTSMRVCDKNTVKTDTLNSELNQHDYQKTNQALCNQTLIIDKQPSGKNDEVLSRQITKEDNVARKYVAQYVVPYSCNVSTEEITSRLDVTRSASNEFSPLKEQLSDENAERINISKTESCVKSIINEKTEDNNKTEPLVFKTSACSIPLQSIKVTECLNRRAGCIESREIKERNCTANTMTLPVNASIEETDFGIEESSIIMLAERVPITLTGTGRTSNGAGYDPYNTTALSVNAIKTETDFSAEEERKPASATGADRIMDVILSSAGRRCDPFNTTGLSMDAVKKETDCHPEEERKPTSVSGADRIMDVILSNTAERYDPSNTSVLSKGSIQKETDTHVEEERKHTSVSGADRIMDVILSSAGKRCDPFNTTGLSMDAVKKETDCHPEEERKHTSVSGADRIMDVILSSAARRCDPSNTTGLSMDVVKKDCCLDEEKKHTSVSGADRIMNVFLSSAGRRFDPSNNTVLSVNPIKKETDCGAEEERKPASITGADRIMDVILSSADRRCDPSNTTGLSMNVIKKESNCSVEEEEKHTSLSDADRIMDVILSSAGRRCDPSNKTGLSMNVIKKESNCSVEEEEKHTSLSHADRIMDVILSSADRRCDPSNTTGLSMNVIKKESNCSVEEEEKHTSLSDADRIMDVILSSAGRRRYPSNTTVLSMSAIKEETGSSIEEVVDSSAETKPSI